jgi:DNA replication protein DnaC
VEQIDFNTNRTLDKNLFLRLTDCNFIKQSENIVITGMTGTGKSYLACAVGHQACLNGYKVLYSNFGKLLTKLKMAKADNSYLREIIKISNFDLLILDDFGLQTMDHSANISLLEILEDRYGNRSTIIASQIPSENWYELFENPTIADACLDRIIHNAYKLNLEGESMRKTIKTSCGKKK